MNIVRLRYIREEIYKLPSGNITYKKLMGKDMHIISGVKNANKEEIGLSL